MNTKQLEKHLLENLGDGYKIFIINEYTYTSVIIYDETDLPIIKYHFILNDYILKDDSKLKNWIDCIKKEMQEKR